jgi:peptide/nickel transport system substrate-binding protein
MIRLLSVTDCRFHRCDEAGMGNRFGIKDFVIVVLLVALIALVLLSMKQYDRQWEVMQSMNSQLKEHTGDLADIRRQLTSGAVVSGPTTKTNKGPSTPLPPGHWIGAGDDAFARLEQAEKKTGYVRGDWLVDTFRAKLARITPMVSKDAYGATIQGYALESLIERDPVTLEYQPMLARAWEVSEDGLTFRFLMRPGVTFSDGEPLTAYDVEYSYNLVMDQKIDAPALRGFYDRIKSCKAVSKDEVVFVFSEPYFEALGLCGGISVLPKHFYSKFTPDQINNHPGLLMGSGPYRMETPDGWAPGKPMVMYRNERYWGPQPGFDRLVYEEVQTDIAQLNLLRNGKLDILGAMPEQYRNMKEDKELMGRVQVYEYEKVDSGYGFIGWNEKRNGKATLFADKRVRQAMSCLVNYDRLFNEVLLGYGIPVTGPFGRLGKQVDKSLKPYTFDPVRAKKLLAEAGFTKNEAGILVRADGTPFRFKLTVPSGSDFWERVLLPIKDNMASAGVVMELDQLEWAVFAERIKKRDYDALCMAWGGGIENDVHQMFHSKQTEDEGDNFINYSNPTVDKCIDEARRTVDPAKRMPLWQEVHRQLYEDQPYTFLYSRRAIVVLDKRIKNIEELPMGLNSRYEWFVPAGQRRWTK